MKIFRLSLLTALIFLNVVTIYCQNRFWVGTSSGNWNNPANWSTTSGGAGGASVPGSGNVAIFNNAANGSCLLNIAPTVGGITISGYSGTIDLQGNNLTTTGANTFSSGTISNTGATASLILNTAGITTFSGTVFNVTVSGSSGILRFNGSTFNGTVNVTKTGGATDSGTGGNTFNAAVTLTHAGSSSWYLGATNPDVFNSTLTINSNSTSGTFLAYNATNNLFKDNIAINYNSTGSVTFGNSGGTSTLSSGKTVSVASFGASGCGNLQLGGFTQSGSTAQTLTLTGNTNATLTLGPNSSFNGTVTASSPILVLNASTFNRAASFTQTGGASDGNSRGGNVFASTVSFTNTGDTDIMLGANVADPGDIFNGDATFNDLGGGRIRIGGYTAGNTFNANATFNSSGAVDNSNRIQVSRFTGASTTFNGTATFINNGNSSDIHISYEPGTTTTFNGPVIFTSSTSASGDFFVGNDGDVIFNGNIQFNSTCSDNIQMNAGAGTVTFGNGNISIGPLGFAQGQLTFRNFTQTGTATTSITLTGSSILTLGPNSKFNNNFTGIAPRLNLNGCTYNGTTYLEKTGTSTDNSQGNNIFNGTTTLVNSSSGVLRSGLSNLDTFNGDLTVTNSGTASIQLAYQASGTIFNGNIVVNNTGGAGVLFGQNGGTSALANGKTITIGPSGFTTGELGLRQFTQQGSTSQNVTLTGTALLRLGPSSQFDGNVNFVAPQILLNGTTYNGTAYIEKNGATDNYGNGGNNFNGTSTIVNSGSGYLVTAGSSPDTFTGDVTITNTGTNGIYLAHNVPGSVFNGNIILNNTTGQGITFAGGASGTATLGAGKTISVGGVGFTGGNLRLFRFTQVGATAQNLTLTGTATLTLGPTSQFDGNVNFTSPQVLLNGTTYNGTAYIEKTGAVNNAGNGGNIFNGVTTIVNSGSGYLLTANVSPDTFNGDVTLTNSGSNTIYVAYNVPGTQFNGNIIVNSTFGSGVYFGSAANGTATLADGKTISVGALGFSRGELRLHRFTQIGNTPQNLTLSLIALLRLGPSTLFNGAVNFVAPQMLVTNTTFAANAYLEKSGATDNVSAGGNIFNGSTTIVNSGSGTFDFGSSSPETFNGNLTVNNTGTYRIQIGIDAANNIFNGDVTINHGGIASGALNTIIARNATSSAVINGNLTLNSTNSNSASGITIGNDGTVVVNGNIKVSSTNGRGVSLANGTGQVTLSNGFTISDAGAGTFTTGTLLLKNFTQVGTTAQTLTLTAGANLTLGGSSTFNGNVNFKAPTLFLNGTTFNNSTTTLEKTGATNDDSQGNNIFNGVTTIINSGNGYLRSAVAAGALDAFNNDLTLTNSGAGSIRMADLASGTVFNGNVVVNSTAGTGVFFGNSGGSSTLANSKTISVGSSGFSFGTLLLRNFTQVGGTSQTVILPSAPLSTALLQVGPNSSFNGNITFKAPRVQLNGATYNGTATIEKTGANADNSTGNNIFNQASFITNSGSGDFVFSNTAGALDQFNADLTLTNTGSAWVRMSNTATGSIYAGNIIFNCTSGGGISFGNNGGTSTLSSGRTLSLGGSGFITGTLLLRNFTQTGSTAQALTLTGTAILQLGSGSTFNGNVTFISPQLLLAGCTYNGTSYLEKNGATNNDGFGNNIFNSSATIVNSGTGYLRLSNDNTAANNGDAFNSDVIFTKSNSGALQPAYNRTSYFGGNVTINSAAVLTFGSGNGIVQFNGSNAQTINKGAGSATPVIQRLTMSKTSNTVTLNTTVDIGASATFTSGVMNTSTSALLNFVNTATVAGANNSSYVDGPVRKTGNQAFTFPVGNGSFYRAIAISAPGSATDQFTAQYFRAAQPYGGKTTWDPSFYTVSGCEYWILDRTTGASNVSVTLTWDENACGGAGYITSPANLRVARWNNTSWVSQGNGGTTGTTSAGTIVSSGTVNSFSPFTLASVTPSNPLPVELKRFWAVDLDNVVQLNWITVTEKNNASFTVQRSVDAFEFETVATKEGAGNSMTELRYSVIDDQPLPGISYYKLIQTDYDGNSKSWIISVQRKGENPVLSVYPNPAGNETIHLNQYGDFEVRNSLDQTVLEIKGINTLDVTGLAPGVYMIRNQKGQYVRFVKE